MTCSSPISGLEVFWGIILGFVSHMVDILQLSVAVRLAIRQTRCIHLLP
jgi:hypothetical protein